MKRILLGLLLASPLLQAADWRDIVYLKNGSVIKGTLIEQLPGKSLKIMTADGDVYAYPMSSVEKLSKEQIEAAPPPESTPLPQSLPSRIRPYRRRAPGTAWFLSALYPGMGQYYVGDPVKGVAQQLLYTGAWMSAFYFGVSYDSHLVTENSYYYNYSYTAHDPYYNQTFFVSLGIAVAVSLWSQMDAPVSAARRNRAEDQKYGHLIEIDSKELAWGMDLEATPDGKALSRMTLHF